MSREPNEERDDARVLEAAAEWLLRLRDDVATDEDVLSWMRWCEANPRNQQAFDRVEELWSVSGALALEIESGRFPPIPEAIGEPARARKWFGPRRRAARPIDGSRFPLRPLAVGAACAALVALAFMLGRSRTLFAPPPSSAPHFPMELVREAELADGSKVQLATRSTVSIQYTPTERLLEVQGGQAYFTVAHDEARPFVVAAGKVRVRAVGTTFDVRRAGDRVVVTVVEGKVQIYRSDERVGAAPQDADALTVPAGGQVRWEADAPGPELASVSPSQVLSWREGRLEYTNEPLRAVIEDLNRYSARPVVIADEGLGRLRFTGTLFAESVDEWLATLPETLPVRVESRGGTEVILGAESPRSAG